MKKFANLSMRAMPSSRWRAVCSIANSPSSTGFEGATSLGLVHPHYLVLGALFFVVLMMLEKNFQVSRKLGRLLVPYQIELNLSVAMMLVRGVTQVLAVQLSSGADAAISGIAGLGHIILGVSLVMVLFKVRDAACAGESN